VVPVVCNSDVQGIFSIRGLAKSLRTHAVTMPRKNSEQYASLALFRRISRETHVQAEQAHDAAMLARQLPRGPAINIFNCFFRSVYVEALEVQQCW
jgi:hypothetical protein